MIPYRDYILQLIPDFDEITFRHIPIYENQLAHALATLETIFKVIFLNHASNIHILRYKEPTHVFPSHCLSTKDVSYEKTWYYDIKKYLEKQEYPEGARICDKRTLRRLASKFLLSGDILYKRNYDSVLLRCVDRHEEESIIKEIYEGSFGTHSSGHSMAKKTLRVDTYGQ